MNITVNNKKTLSAFTIALTVLLNSYSATAEQYEFKKIKPTPEIVAQARNNPNTWVYIIDGDYQGKQEVPQHAIVGSWQVDEKGEIIKDSFLANPNYKKITEPLNSI